MVKHAFLLNCCNVSLNLVDIFRAATFFYNYIIDIFKSTSSGKRIVAQNQQRASFGRCTAGWITQRWTWEVLPVVERIPNRNRDSASEALSRNDGSAVSTKRCVESLWQCNVVRREIYIKVDWLTRWLSRAPFSQVVSILVAHWVRAEVFFKQSNKKRRQINLAFYKLFWKILVIIKISGILCTLWLDRRPSFSLRVHRHGDVIFILYWSTDTS